MNIGENPEKIPDRRLANLKPPWGPDNPAPRPGRPKGPSLTTILLKSLSQRDKNNIPKIYKFAESLIILAQKGNPAAIKAVTDRIDPIPLVPIEINMPVLVVQSQSRQIPQKGRDEED